MAKLIKEANKAKEKIAASEEELKVAFSGPAIASNRMFVTIGPGGARIAFTEQQGGSPATFRTAVMLSIQDAISLKNVLTELLKDVEEQVLVAANQDG